MTVNDIKFSCGWPQVSLSSFPLTLYVQTSLSFQECLRLLEETFPFGEEQQPVQPFLFSPLSC